MDWTDDDIDSILSGPSPVKRDFLELVSTLPRTPPRVMSDPRFPDWFFFCFWEGIGWMDGPWGLGGESWCLLVWDLHGSFLVLWRPFLEANLNVCWNVGFVVIAIEIIDLFFKKSLLTTSRICLSFLVGGNHLEKRFVGTVPGKTQWMPDSVAMPWLGGETFPYP